MTNLSLGNRLRAARQKAGLTQSEVAARLGVTYQAISNYERGKCRVESGVLRQLCILYHVSPVALLETAEWDESQRRLYESAETAAEKLSLFELLGVPAELEDEYARLTAQQKAAVPGDDGLSAEESALIALFRSIPEANRALVLDMVKAALNSQGLL